MELNKPHTNVIIRYMMVSLLSILLIMLQACQFDSDADNFIELQKPDDELTILIDIGEIDSNEIIYVRPYSTFRFHTTAEGKELLDVQFFLDGTPLQYDHHNGAAYIEEPRPDNKIHDLTVIVAFSSGTGSLAEHAGLEAYIGQHNFQLKYIMDPPQLNMRRSINQSNQLLIEWDAPKEYEISHYEIINSTYHSTAEPIGRIYNTGESSYSYAIPDYVYGRASYTVLAYIKNSPSEIIIGDISIMSEPITAEHFRVQRTGFNEMHISWENPNPYPAQYMVQLEDDTYIAVPDNKAGTTIPVDLFPTTRIDIILYVLPQSANPEDYMDDSHRGDATIFLSDPTIHSVDAIDLKNNMMHKFVRNTIESYDLDHLELINTTTHNQQLSSGVTIDINQAGHTALDVSEHGKTIVKVYQDYSLSSIPIFQVEQPTINRVSLANNNLLLVEQTYDSSIELYDIYLREKVFFKKWTISQADIGGFFSINTYLSSDGKQLLVHCFDPTVTKNNKWIEHYSIDNNYNLQLVDTRITTDETLEQLIHPKNGDIILSDNRSFTIANPLNNIKQTIQGILLGVDPITGNLAYYSYPEHSNSEHGDLLILNSDYSQELLRMPVSYEPSGGSFFNNVIQFGGSYINLNSLNQ